MLGELAAAVLVGIASLGGVWLGARLAQRGSERAEQARELRRWLDETVSAVVGLEVQATDLEITTEGRLEAVGTEVSQTHLDKLRRIAVAHPDAETRTLAEHAYHLFSLYVRTSTRSMGLVHPEDEDGSPATSRAQVHDALDALMARAREVTYETDG
ncbi:hypothetical protein [Egicoccus halophilus]|uniref:Uncharacterized protein n=1 Tax=Egicoccus halophilus TaxID=1670830 RepID=A0A8J3EW69_9ACTN|nr:hypothetical protein [Egicoccus halophilus]GGI02825.1 hypothetical protein GCM10011354_01670 [Egicoccus halophilus]